MKEREVEAAEPLRILHLEDDPNDVLLVRAALDREGIPIRVRHVSTREEFTAVLEEESVDLILSDFQLPSFNGIQALGIALELAPHAPFILVSGTLGEEAAIQSLRNGATDYVLKHQLSRLAPAARRAVEEAAGRRARLAVERALEAERQFLRALLESLETGVVACDREGALTLLNRATRELHGLPQEPVPLEDWVAHYQLLQADGKTALTPDAVPLVRALRGEHFRHYEMVIRHANGTPRDLVVSGQPILDEQGDRLGAVVTMQDVTEHKLLERQFRQVQKMEAMGKLAAGVAHDFNNLLTVISGYTQLARHRLSDSDPLFHDLDEIHKATERAAKLTRHLLAFSRQQVLELRVLDLNTVVAEVDRMLRRLIGADIDLTFTPGADLGKIRADAGQLEQVLLNLIVNARDAMPLGGSIRIETANHEQAGGSYVLLSVTDTGCGMDAETASRAFEPFFTTKEVGRGTGLGLSTVHGIVTQSGGQIRVQSEPGCGARFEVLLPRVEGSVAAVRPVSLPAPQRGAGTLLVVDDDRAVLGLVHEVLRLHGYRVIEASTPDEALRALEAASGTIDAVITDVVMPGMGGRELYRRLEQLRPGLPTLFMSGYVGENVDSLGAILGARVGFLQKPFTPSVLLARVSELIDSPASEAA